MQTTLRRPRESRGAAAEAPLERWAVSLFFTLALAGAGAASAQSADPAGEGEPRPSPGAQEDREEITVLGTRSERPLFTLPAATHVRDGEALTHEQPSSYADVFEGIPGVSIQGGARRIAQQPNIRGFSDSQIAIRVDGSRQNFDLGHRGRFFIDPDLLRRVEVLRGPGSALYGSGALGGVIALSTASAPDLLQEDESLGGRYRFGYQTNGHESLHSLCLFGREGWIDGMANLTWREGREDLEDGGGGPILATRDRVQNRLLKLALSPRSGHRLEWTSAAYQNDGVNPSAADSLATAQNIVDRDTRWHSDQLAYRYRSEDSEWWDLRAQASHTRADVSEARFFDGRDDESDFETRSFEVHNTSRFSWGRGLELALTLGGEMYRDAQGGARDGERRDQYPEAEVRYRAGFAQLELNLRDRLFAIPGLRYDAFELDAEGFEDRRDRRLSPRLALGWRFDSGVYLWGALSRAFRAPSLTELYARGVHFQVPLGPGEVVVNEFRPNPRLAPESGRTAELGLRLEREDFALPGAVLRAELTGFQAHVDDFVDTVVSFIDPGPPEFLPDGTTLFRGSTRSVGGAARLRGIEGRVRFAMPHWAVEIGGFALDAQSRESGEGLGSTPADALLLSVQGSLPGWEAWVFGGRARFTRRQNDVPPGSRSADGYQVFDLFASWTPESGPLEGVSFTVAIDNLLDEKFRIHPSEVPQPGRSLRVSAGYRFGVGR